MRGALREPAQGFSIDLEVGGGIDREMADREPLRPRERRPSRERELEPGQVELAPHGERDGGERLVDVPFEGETQVHPFTLRWMLRAEPLRHWRRRQSGLLPAPVPPPRPGPGA